NIDREACVLDEGIEYNPYALAAVDDGEAVECYDEEEIDRSGQTGRNDDCVREEGSNDDVSVIIVFAVKDGLFCGVDGDVLEHAEKVEGCESLDEAEADLNAVGI
ncbi:MAG: hypothetical protein Q9179_005230, partial [Wetmoreana sp. 5 TL-2023]